MKGMRWLAAAVLVAAAGCSFAKGGICEQRAAANVAVATITPITMRVADAPVPVLGSDGRYHVTYELELVNATGEPIALQRLDVLGVRSGRAITTLDATALGQRLVVRDAAAVQGTLGPSQAGIVYLHLSFDSAAAIPSGLEHGLQMSRSKPPAAQTGGCVALAATSELVFDAPLRGPRYIAGDGCCDSVRHVRATLALNGRFHTAQRYAIDWEQLDAQGRIYAGDVKDPASYVIYGKPAYAVADARVVDTVDGLPDSPIGSFPDLPIGQVDGNHVVLDLGGGRFALYAHFKPGSVQVRAGARVKRGQILGYVGSSGRSSEPHLHFQVTDGPSPLVSNGLPYRLTRFTASTRGVSTAAFDQAIIDGQPIATEPVSGAALRERTLPLDRWIVDLPE